MYILNLLNYLSPFSVATDLLVCHLLFLQKENVLKGLRFFCIEPKFFLYQESSRYQFFIFKQFATPCSYPIFLTSAYL